MKALALLLIGLLVGVMCALAMSKALSQREAHGRAAMVLLARHVDALRALDNDRACAGEPAHSRLQQIAFAAREFDYAFATLRHDSPEFVRRAASFRQSIEQSPDTLLGCQDLNRRLDALTRACEDCHRDFR